MRVLVVVALTVGAVAAAALAPGAALAAKGSTRLTLRIKAPAPANATVAGFSLRLVRIHHKHRRKGRAATLALARVAARLPRDVTIYAVVGKQRRSDRVSGAIVAVNRAEAVAASGSATAAARVLLVNLQHPATPKGYRLRVTVAQTANVLNRHRAFSCRRYFAASDLGGASKLAGPNLPGITLGTVIQSACASANNRSPYSTEAEFRAALNARSGSVLFAKSATVPNGVDGGASFNYPVAAFSVLAGRGRQFTSCAFAGGTCAIGTKNHPNDYVYFKLNGTPAPRGTKLPFSLVVSPSVASPLAFEFFGINAAGTRIGPLLTTGP